MNMVNGITSPVFQYQSHGAGVGARMADKVRGDLARFRENLHLSREIGDIDQKTLVDMRRAASAIEHGNLALAVSILDDLETRHGEDTRLLPGDENFAETPEDDPEIYAPSDEETTTTDLPEPAPGAIGAARGEIVLQDDSSDGGVSFQAGVGVAPAHSEFAVRSHELEHVRRNQFRAQLAGETADSLVIVSRSYDPRLGQFVTHGGRTVTKVREKFDLHALYEHTFQRELPRKVWIA